MSDLEEIAVCSKCLIRVDPVNRLACPECDADTELMPVLLLQPLRRLKAKGWIVDKWKLIPIAKKNVLNCELRLCFHMFSPPPMTGSQCNPELINGTPVIVAIHFGVKEVCEALSLWTELIPCFSLPFGQGLCDKCISQGADWYFSRVKCPHVSGIKALSHWNKFSDGPPDKCAYLVEQTMTMPDRYAELKAKGFFDKNPIAGRKCAKWTRTNT